MTVLLVRHADAGDRAGWVGDDRHRPLSGRGVRQAVALVRSLGDRWAPGRIVSSPWVRCVATVAPLAATFVVDIGLAEQLGEGADPGAAADLVRRWAAGGQVTVACTHGDVLPAVLEVLHDRDGVDLGARPRWAKASAWVLDVGPDGRASAAYLEPPA